MTENQESQGRKGENYEGPKKKPGTGTPQLPLNKLENEQTWATSNNRNEITQSFNNAEMIHNPGGDYQGQKCTDKGTNGTIDNQPNLVLPFQVNGMGHLYLSKKCLWGNFVVCYQIGMSGKHLVLNSLKN